MPIKQNDLINEGRTIQKSASFHEKSSITQTAFLCHSHKDKDIVLGLQSFLNKQGWNIYIDWLDEDLPDSPNEETALKIQNKIKEYKLFLFLATQNSTKSRWCPWEIGFADASKGKQAIIIIPTEDAQGNKHGNEYLNLYKSINNGTYQERSGYALFEPNKQSGKWLDQIQ